MTAYSAINRIPKHRTTRAAAFAAVLGVPFLMGCQDQQVVRDAEASVVFQEGTSYGVPVQLGDGNARTYVLTENGAPVEIGVALSETALEGLAAGGPHGEGEHEHFSVPHTLSMPADNATPIQFVALDWNPEGHTPMGIYDKPHFDFHFHMISQAERDAIQPTDPLYGEKAANFPAPSMIPTGYADLATLGQTTPELAAVPLMGMHWVDTASPELGGVPFTETFIYGSWDGEIIFVEPMITKAFLETKPDFQRPLPTAEQGFNPGSYRIYWDDASREYRVALIDFGGIR
jgi:Domain of unknown function (DUF5602)